MNSRLSYLLFLRAYFLIAAGILIIKQWPDHVLS